MVATALAGGLVLATPMGALAQSPAAQAEKTATYNIPAQDLSGALRQFAEVSGLQLIYDSKITAGKRSGGVSGSLTAEAALSRLLAGSGLSYGFTSSGAVTITAGAPQASAGGVRALAPVRVQGFETGGSPVNGVNGSTDPNATEGTGSYTTGGLSIVSKSVQSIKDTPQSVSVVTAQQIQDENLTDLTAILNEAAGVTVINTTGSGSVQTAQFYSRGFQITTLQIDGGAPFDITPQFGYSPIFDASEYDSVQVVRGADGEYGGYGSPGGVVNLVRKMPLDHNQITSETSIGSYNDYRQTLDATGPLALDGKLKGRVALSYEQNDYYYKIAHDQKFHLYGVLEYDPTAQTNIRVGASLDRNWAVPNFSGTFTYGNGTPLNLPISNCYCFSWNEQNTSTLETFAELVHKFNKDWTAKLNISYTDQKTYQLAGVVNGGTPDNPSGFTPVTPSNPNGFAGFVNALPFGFESKQYLADLAVDGAFELFGQRQTVAIGASYQLSDGANGYVGAPALFGQGATSVPISLPTFNPYAPDLGRPSSAGYNTQEFPVNHQNQYAIYANFLFTPIAPLHIAVSIRDNGYGESSTTIFNTLCTPLYQLFGICSNVGSISTTTLPSKYHDNNFTWPPNTSVTYDLTKTLSAYISYTNIYISNGNELTEQHTILQPTTGENGEAGLKWERSDKKLNATLAVFNIEQNHFVGFGYYDPITYGGRSCCYTSAPEAMISQGVDAELAGEILPGWNFTSSYTYNRTEQKGRQSNHPGEPIYSQQPKNHFKLFTNYHFQTDDWLKRVSIGGGVMAQSSTFNQAYDFLSEQKSYYIVSLHADYKIDKHWDLSANGENVFDTRYYQTLGLFSGNAFYGAPASFKLVLRGKW